jgi:heme-degrading monooxygenase HmoA
MYRHTVVFALKHAHGSLQEKMFLRDAATALKDLPGISNFEVLKQLNADNSFSFGISMEFADKAHYEAYDRHPKHTAFVHDRWNREVERFMEIDYEPI